MKKNVMMRIASVLLVAVMLTTCVISGTFAKYVTSGEGYDQARVAKFGVTVTEKFETLFANAYATHDAWTDDTDKMSVVSSDVAWNVVAPGTEGELADFVVTGTPEVDVSVSYEADLELLNWAVDGGAQYCPIVITVNGNEFSMDAYANLAAFEAAVEAEIVASAKKYNANTNLGDAANVANDLSVSWKWHFEGVNEGGTGPACQWDKFDTYLGDEAAKDNAATIKLTVKCIVTQID